MNAPKPMQEPFSTDLAAASSVGKPIERRDCRARKNWGPVLLCLLGVAGFAVLLRTQHLSDISLHFDECCSWKISQFPWHEMLDAVSRDAHHTQRVTRQKDGSVTLRFQIDGLNEILHWLLSWAGRVRVQQPAELKELFVTALKDAIALQAAADQV